MSAAPSTNRGVCAVVLYDYEPAEENEMQLVEGETIEQIEQIDEGELMFPGMNVLERSSCEQDPDALTVCCRMVVRRWCRWEEWIVPRYSLHHSCRRFAL
jgi:hypothetical protein